MIKPILAEKHYKPDLGDLVWDFDNDKVSKYLVYEEGPGTDKIIPFACAHPNPWVVCGMFDIDLSLIKLQYECPYTRYAHYSLLPTALLINGDVQAYKKVKYHSPEYILDWEWHKQMFPKDLLGLSRIQKIMLGSGYTNFTGFNDGSGSIVARRVMLDNGDAVLVHFHEWYNK
jgi:hypothetical protein